MTVQTTYLTQLPVAYEGQVADSSMHNEIVSSYVSATCAPGRMLCRDTSDTLSKLPASAADLAVPIGISIYDSAKAPGLYGATLPTGQTFPAAVPCLRRGRMWVIAEITVTQGQPVFVRHTANGGSTILGGFRNTADAVLGVDTAAQIDNAVWATSATTGNLAQVEINLP